MSPASAGPAAPAGLSAEEKRRLLATLLAERRARVRTFPLSSNQERVWFMDQLAPGDPSFNIHYALPLAFALDVSALRDSLNALIRRHESLRTTFRLEGDDPVQVVAPALEIDLPIEDLSTLSADERRAEADRLTDQEAVAPFNLTTGPLIRARLLRLDRTGYRLLLTLHHIVSDGWSMGIFFQELTTAYQALALGRTPAFTPLPIQYGDYAAWQREHLRGETLARQLQYWTDRLRGLPDLQLPLDRPRPAFQTSRGGTHVFGLGRSLSQRIEALGRREGVTTFMTLLAAYKVLLARYTGQEDIVVGSYVANRTHAELEGLIGFFVNTLVFRTDLSGDPTFSELLQRVRETVTGGQAHQEIPFTRLVAELAPARDMSRNPLFQVVFQLFKPPTGAASGGSSSSSPSSNSAGLSQAQELPRGQTAIFDLAFNMWEAADGLCVQAEYNTDLFVHDTIVRMGEHFKNLLDDVVVDAERPVSRLTLLSAREVRQQIEDWNRTERPLPSELSRDGSLVRLFEERADAHPEAPAFLLGTEAITYGALERRANAIASRLIAAGVTPGDFVGVCLGRTFELPAAMLAVFKCGAVYVPFEPEYPAARLRFMLSDAGARWVIADEHTASTVDTPDAVLLRVESIAADASAQARADADAGVEAAIHAGTESEAGWPGVHRTADDLAYVVYTSGSTGKPKGIAVAHRQILNRLAWMWREYPFAPGEVGCHKTAISFVDSLWELLGPLLRGVPTAILSARAGGGLDEMIRELAAQRVTRFWFVPSLLRAMLEVCPDLGARLPQLTFWVASGEALDVGLLESFRQAHPNARLFNLYGASEFWDATWYDATGTQTAAHVHVPIGKPIDNMRAYVLDARQRLLPVGCHGELHIAGSGLADRYLNRDARTADRFVTLPFGEGPAFATGDVVRLLADGTIVYVGRADAQIKIRGSRVDPQEVEVALARHDAIRRAAVVARPDHSGALALHAFVVFEPVADAAGSASASAVPATADLRRYLQSHLPDFMIPVTFTARASLPETPSGKVDRRALAQAEAPLTAATEYVAPRTPDEEEVARIWATVLGRDCVGVHDDFFDLGGHSLLATQVVSRLRKARGVELPLRTCFEHPTLAALAREVTRLTGNRTGDTRPRVARVSRDQYRIQRPGA